MLHDNLYDFDYEELDAEAAALAPPVGFAIELTDWPSDEEWAVFYEECVNFEDDSPE